MNQSSVHYVLFEDKLLRTDCWPVDVPVDVHVLSHWPLYSKYAAVVSLGWQTLVLSCSQLAEGQSTECPCRKRTAHWTEGTAARRGAIGGLGEYILGIMGQMRNQNCVRGPHQLHIGLSFCHFYNHIITAISIRLVKMAKITIKYIYFFSFTSFGKLLY